MTENELMLTSILDCRRVDLAVDQKPLTPAQQSQYDQMQLRRRRGEPLQYIIGGTSFMGISLAVDKRVLIPRPETEILVELALERLNARKLRGPLSILDVGTGSGNIAIALAKNITNSTITAVDVSRDALIIAAKNAKTNDVAKQITFVPAGMEMYFKEMVNQSKAFDMIISNPPYIPARQWAQLPGDVQQEPQLALNTGEDGLHFHKIILRDSHPLLKSDGFLMFEIGDGQRAGLEEILKQYSSRYQNIHFHKDYVGTDRICEAWKS